MATPSTNGVVSAEKERPNPDQDPSSPDTVGPVPSNGDSMSLSAGERHHVDNGNEGAHPTAAAHGPDNTSVAHTKDQPATTDAMNLDEQDAGERKPSEQEDTNNSPEPAVVRRSGRSRKAPTNYEDEYIIPASQPTITSSTPALTRPKRKAATAAQKAFTSKEDLDVVTNAICTPMTSEELKSYKGWVELESEPWFFQAMLQEMGAPDLKITELFSTDEGSLGALPKPVYGLIFLFPYEDTGEENAEERHDCPEGLWFANQTTSNACATVALMNITMNTPDENLGSELRSFKDATIPLNTVDRGHTLDSNDFIRCIHNSVARRTQLLNEDLAWKNKMDEEEKEQRRQQRAIKNLRGKGRGKKKAGSKKKKKKDNLDIANHYIAYVPHDGKVWEFDGLEDKPLCLGKYAGDADSWTMTAIETIQVRMAAGIFSNTFNLLAVCASPLQDLTSRFAQTLAAARMLEETYTNPPPTSPASSPSTWPHPAISTLYPPTRLQSLNNLGWDTVAATQPTPALLKRIQPAAHDEAAGSPDPEGPGSAAAADHAGLRMVELLADLADLEGDLAAELAGRQSAQHEYAARRRDFTPFVHQFLLALAEKGALDEVVANFC
jgi:ubiquitin carboxyl-terminal hydrolase L5